jgi:hypothetical protein
MRGDIYGTPYLARGIVYWRALGDVVTVAVTALPSLRRGRRFRRELIVTDLYMYLTSSSCESG